MLPQDHARGRSEARILGDAGPAPREADPHAIDQRGGRGDAEGELPVPAESKKKSIDVVFDLSDPEQAKKLEWHRKAFGDGHAEVEELGGGKVILKLHPGGATKGLP